MSERSDYMCCELRAYWRIGTLAAELIRAEDFANPELAETIDDAGVLVLHTEWRHLRDVLTARLKGWRATQPPQTACQGENDEGPEYPDIFA